MIQKSMGDNLGIMLYDEECNIYSFRLRVQR